MRRGQPLVERHLGTLVQRAHRYRERLAAGIAVVEAGTRSLALHQGGLAHNATMRAARAVLPKLRLKPFTRLVGVVKHRVRKVVGLGHGLSPETNLGLGPYYVKVI